MAEALTAVEREGQGLLGGELGKGCLKSLEELFTGDVFQGRVLAAVV